MNPRNRARPHSETKLENTLLFNQLGITARRLLRPALAGAAVILAAGAALAQQPANPPAPPAAPSGSARPAGAEPSPAAVNLAREVIVASGLSRSFDIIVPQFLDQIGTNLTQTRPDLIRDLNAVMEGIKPEFDKQTADVITGAARAYAQRLNEKQLKDIADFFKSPSGQAYVTAQPQVMGDLFTTMQGFTQRLSGEMMTRVREEMKKRGHQL